MAIPSLAAMAALTLFHNPHMQPEDVSVDYTGYSVSATRIQRSWRRGVPRRLLSRAATRINALIRAFGVRCFIMGITPRYPHTLYDILSDRIAIRQTGYAIRPRMLTQGRRYLGQRRRSNWERFGNIFQLGPANPNLAYPTP